MSKQDVHDDISAELTLYAGDKVVSTVTVTSRCVIGSSEQADLRVAAPGVAWEHAMVTVDNGMVALENLSASGVVHKAKQLAGTVKLKHNDRFQLNDNVEIRVAVYDANGKPVGRRDLRTLLVASLLGVVLLGGVVQILEPPTTPAAPRFGDDDWRRARVAIEEHMVRWILDGDAPPSTLTLFRDAHRLENGSDPERTYAVWAETWTLVSQIRVGTTEHESLLAEKFDDAQAALRDLLSNGGMSMDSERIKLAAYWYCAMRCSQHKSNN